jgi:lipoic acid synthetase
MPKLPTWLIKKIPKQQNIKKVRELLGEIPLCTVCQSAKCPNIGECFSRHTLTFMILGDVCTRNCQFCAVKKSSSPTTHPHNSTHNLFLTPIPHTSYSIPLSPLTPPDPQEPQHIADAAKKLGLAYIVITSVTRDDLEGGGAQHFANCIQAVKQQVSAAKVEVLTPDFGGNLAALHIVMAAGPQVFNHNVETVPRLYPAVRPQADFSRSLKILSAAKAFSAKNYPQKNCVYTKSGFMVGLGESFDEVVALLNCLRQAAVDIVTIGQYLAPSKSHFPVKEYLHPEVFMQYAEKARGMGFLQVAAGPFIRSSYQAEQLIQGK